MHTAAPITELLLRGRASPGATVEGLLPLVYAELRDMADRQLRRENPGHTLSPTALVHEAYIRLVDQTRVQWQDRAHFFAIASQAMRRVLVDHARRHRAARRGGGVRPLALDEVEIPLQERAEVLVALDEALHRLEALDTRLARVVELRFFGGLTETEAAEVLGVAERTVRRDWVKARGWLLREMEAGQ
ncbi:MAG: polymerase sigma factor [Gemmatimonadetes bacterium]|nr:polymerase sigma factor [Gemmatimonadota bacterium]